MATSSCNAEVIAKAQPQRRRRVQTVGSYRETVRCTVKNFPQLLATIFVLFLAATLPVETDAWIAPNHSPRINRRLRSNPHPSSSLGATLEEHKSEEDKSSLPPRRTRRIDDILNEYEETGDAGLTISILESTLKREQEKSSTLAVRLAYAERVIEEQKKNLEDKRSTLQKKSQALSETQRKLRELEQRIQQNSSGVAPPRAVQRSQMPPPANPQAPWQQPPLTSSERQYPLITNWSINRNTGEVTGSVSCHPSIPDGTTIVTSGLNPESFALTGDDFVFSSDRPATVVKTLSGSMYQLGVKKIRMQAPPVAQTPAIPKQQPQQPHPLNNQYPNLEYPLTGQSISNGRGSKYLLAGTPMRKPSGRSEIHMAYKCDDMLKSCDIQTVYVVKLSTYKDKLRREFENFREVQDYTVNKNKNNGWIGGAISNIFDQQAPEENPFVGCYEFLPICEGSIVYAQHSAIVLEKGHEDLRIFEYRLQKEHDEPDAPVPSSMDLSLVRASLLTAASCLQILHSKARLVWTDLKAENLILMTPQGTETPPGTVASIKGIDLESAIPHRGNPLDYTPEACPPEFAVFHKKGNAYEFVLDYSYDVWSFGMLAYELATGKAYFRGKSPDEIMAILADPDFVSPLDTPEARQINDPDLEDLIRRCTTIDPRQRISVSAILRHPFLQNAQQQQQQQSASPSEAGGGFGGSGGTFW